MKGRRRPECASRTDVLRDYEVQSPPEGRTFFEGRTFYTINRGIRRPKCAFKMDVLGGYDVQSQHEGRTFYNILILINPYKAPFKGSYNIPSVNFNNLKLYGHRLISYWN